MLPGLIAVAADPDTLDYLSRVGVVGILILALYGFKAGWWVFGREHEDLKLRHDLLRKRCERIEANEQAWKEQALTGQRVAERSTSIAEAAVKRAAQIQEGQ